MNIYLIVCDKIQKNGENDDNEYNGENEEQEYKIDMFMLFNLYYGFKTAYTRLVKLIETEINPTNKLDIEEDADEIIQNNSKMIEMLLITLAGSVGAAGITAVAAMGGKRYTKKNKRRYNKVSKNRHKNKKGKKTRKGIKLRRKYNRITRRL